MEAFEIDPNENPMITALRKLGEEERERRERLRRLKADWPAIMSAERGLKSWDETNPDILESLANRYYR